MIIEKISVKNWRSYREPHTFQFENGVNLVVGRNEAGKSTLFEALTRALFDRYNSKAEEIRAMQPLGSSLGPEVTVQFQSNETRYKVVKRFLQDPRSELFSERQGRWEKDHEGDQADNRLREILRGEATTRTAARSEHRGLAQALWYLQSDGVIPEKTWNEGVRQGLQGLVQIVATSPRERAILERLEGTYKEHWTPTGRIAANSELGRLKAEIPTLEDALSKLRDRAEIVERYRSDLEESLNKETEKQLELHKAEKDLADIAEQVQVTEELEREMEAIRQTQKDAAEKLLRIQRDLSQIQDMQKKISEWKGEVHDLDESLSEATAEARQESIANERHGRRWKEELEPPLKRVEAELRALLAATNLRKLEKEKRRLEKHLEKVSDIRDELEGRKKDRNELLAPNAKEMKRFAKVSQDLSVVEAKVEASAVRIGFEWDNKVRKVTTQPHLEETEAGDFIVTEPTEFRVLGVGRIHVRSGAESLKEMVEKKEQLRREISETLGHFDVADIDGLASIYERRRDLDRTIGQLAADLAEAESAEPEAEVELTRVIQGIDEETRTAGELAAESSERGDQSIRNEIAVKEREKECLIGEIAKEQELEKRSGQKHLELVKAREKTSNKLAERKAQLKTHEEAITATLQVYGTMDHLERLAGDAKEELEKAKSTLENLLKGYEERVETPRRLYLQAQERVKELDKQLQDIRTHIAGTLARIEESAEHGNYSQFADMEIELERKERRIDALQRRADGTKLLYTLVRAHERQRSAVLSGPVQDLTNRWLQLLTEGNYDAVRIDGELKPAGVHVTRYEADLPMTSLSHGAQEQVVVLLRLAIGVLISREEPNLVVIDDRLVNADTVRMKRLCLILEEAAQKCQIIIATCNDTPYAGVGANIIRVPSDSITEEACT